MLKEKTYPNPGNTYPRCGDGIPTEAIEQGRYRARFALSPRDLGEIQRLRFDVFNREMGEGLQAAWATGVDEDTYDQQCHHLLVEDQETLQVVGTYRMQTAPMAAMGQGFYSADEYDLTAIPRDILGGSLELGRACIHRNHRNRYVLFLLWKGLAQYLVHNNLRYLFGCCSLTSQDPEEGWRAYDFLTRRHKVHPSLDVPVLPDLRCEKPASQLDEEVYELPSLFKTYLRYGGLICSAPAMDRAFKTIDFLLLFDVENMDKRSIRLFFGNRA